jgi:dethiobiotin synthetase
MKPLADIIVVGTDTGIGKSVVSLLLMQLLNAKCYHPFYLKPFQTGCIDPYDTDSDAAFVYRHTAALKGKDCAQSVMYCHPNPKAPFFAARDAGESIDVDHVYRAIEQKRSVYSPLIVETAGGLQVPVTGDLTVMDLIPRLNCRPILVARAGLGTINHTLLSIKAMQQRNIVPLGVLFVQSVHPPTDPVMIAENMEAIEKFSRIQVGGEIPFIADFSTPAAQTYQPLEKLLF